MLCNFVYSQRALSLGIIYLASFSKPLPSLFKSCPWVPKVPRPRGHVFYLKIDKEKLRLYILLILTPN